MEEEISTGFEQIDADLLNTRRRQTFLEAEVRNLCRAVAEGLDSPAIRVAIAEREHEIRELMTKVSSAKKGSVQHQVKSLCKFVEASMGNFRDLIAGHKANVASMRMHLSRHVDKIVLMPDGEGRDIKYVGSWKLLGNSDGAEGQS